jgi:hypothetical protein
MKWRRPLDPAVAAGARRSPFHIAAPTSQRPERRTWRFRFEVTNDDPGPLKVFATISKNLPHHEWAAVGSETQDLAPGASMKCTVHVAVPEGARAGSYRFRLVVALERDPETVFDEKDFEVKVRGPDLLPLAVGAVVLAIALVLAARACWTSARRQTLSQATGGQAQSSGSEVAARTASDATAPAPRHLRDPCPDGTCGQGLDCVDRGGTMTCLYAAGQSCSAPDQCATADCQNGACTERPNPPRRLIAKTTQDWVEVLSVQPSSGTRLTQGQPVDFTISIRYGLVSLKRAFLVFSLGQARGDCDAPPSFPERAREVRERKPVTRGEGSVEMVVRWSGARQESQPGFVAFYPSLVPAEGRVVSFPRVQDTCWSFGR